MNERMVDLVYDTLNLLFGTGITGKLAEIMLKLLDVLSDLLTYNSGSTIPPVLAGSLQLFGVVAVGFITISFFWSLISQASRGIVTFEMVAGSLIQLCIMMFIILNMPQIISLIIQFSKALYTQLDPTLDKSIFGLTGGKQIGLNLTRDDLNQFEGRFAFIDYIKPAIISILFMLLSLIAQLMGILFCVSNAIMVVVHAILMPLGVCTCASGSNKDFGMRIIKRFIGLSLTMPIYAIGLQVAPMINYALVKDQISGNQITKDNWKEVFEFGNVPMLLVSQFSVIGITAACGAAAKELFM